MKMTMKCIVLVLFAFLTTLQPMRAMQRLFPCCCTYNPLEDFLEHDDSVSAENKVPLFLKQPRLVFPGKKQNMLKVGKMIVNNPEAPMWAGYINLFRVDNNDYVLLVGLNLKRDNKTWLVKAFATKRGTNITYQCEFLKEMTNANTAIIDAVAILTEQIQTEALFC